MEFTSICFSARHRTCAALLFIVLFSASTAVHGQDTPEEPAEYVSIRKGKVLLGTYFNFSVSTVEKIRATSLDTKTDVLKAGINITGGKMLSDHWGILLIGGYSQSSSTTPVTVGANTYTFEDFKEDYTIAPAVRYYALISEATYFFVQGTVFVSRGTATSDEFNGTNIVNLKLKTTGFGVGISPGISYFMTDKLSSEISIGVLGYSIISGEDDLGNKSEAKTFQSLLYLNSVSLGFVYYL